MGKIEFRSREIVMLVSQFIRGEVECTIDYEFHCYTFKIYNGEHGWNWRGDIYDIMNMPPNKCAWKICTSYRDWLLTTYFQNKHLGDLLHSRKEQPL